MGQLIDLQELTERERRKYILQNPSYNSSWHDSDTIQQTFPFMASIHARYFGYNHISGLRQYTTLTEKLIEIRRFCNKSCSGDVLFIYREMNYSYAYEYVHNGLTKCYKHDVYHGYMDFYFEYIEDMTIFSINFGNIIEKHSCKNSESDATDEQILYFKNNPYKWYD